MTKLAWQDIQDELSEKSGIAVVIVDGSDSAVVSESNNNSICRTLQGSAEFSHLCERYCGRAFTQGLKIGKPASFRCHAGLTYATVPVEVAEDKKLVAIVGRAFRTRNDYLEATEKIRSGDWKTLPQDKLLENVLMTGSLKELEDVARKLQGLDAEEKESLLDTAKSAAYAVAKQKQKQKQKFDEDNMVLDLSPVIRDRSENKLAQKTGKTISITSEILLKTEPKPVVQPPVLQTAAKKVETEVETLTEQTPVDRRHEELEEVAQWRSLFNSLLDMNYHQACVSVLKFLSVKHGFKALAWLERKNDLLETYLVGGSFKGQQLRVNLPVKDPRLIAAINQESALELLERNGEVKTGVIAKISLFPLVVGGEMRSALVIGDDIMDDSKKRSLARFCRQVSVPLEILRLRDEIGRQAWLNKSIKKFNEGLTSLDSDEFWPSVARSSAELLQAELGSMLLYNADDESLTAEASVGKDVNILSSNSDDIGKRVAERVMKNGKPIVVTDVANTGLPPAPSERKYKTRSFLSYPLVFGEEKVGVLNMTDKVDGGVYDEYDLELLNAVTPQLAVAFDRAKLERKAGKYEQLSITDSLTGLLNRRYLEERLSEEINRSRRSGSPMTFVMIDVDEFKSYNDSFLHTAGDKVLQILAQCMKDCLRGADVAARYGGEEFSILLPQTALTEAKVIAERIRERVESTDFPNRRVTISMGIAAYTPDIKTPVELISSADKALYEAKRQGRNNVQIFQNAPALQASTGNVSEAN